MIMVSEYDPPIFVVRAIGFFVLPFSLFWRAASINN